MAESFLFRAKRYLRRKIRQCRSGSTVSHPEFLHPEAQVLNSTLAGKVVVEAGAIIRDSHFMVSEARIGRHTRVWGPNVHVHCLLHPVEIGSYCSIARNVSIQEYNHRIDRISSFFVSCNLFGESMVEDVESRGPVIIGNDVWLAANVTVASGVRIGDGAVIGANSVVLSDIPPYAVAAGSPAKVLRYRFPPEVVSRLLELQWWNWDEARIQRNRALFSSPLSSELLDKVK